MANPIIKIKRSAVAGKIPTTTDLQLGELAINTYDGKVFIQQDQSSVGIASTVITINPWSVGTGTNTYNTYFTAGSVGIGTTNPGSKLTVGGAIQIQQDSSSNNRLIFRGQPGSPYRWNIDNYSSSNQFRIFREDDTTSANGSVAVSISTTGTVTATKFSGDGSLLTGITASGAGIVVQNQGSTVGTAGTLNFSTNLTASFASGTATISLSNNPVISGILTADQVYTSNNGNGQNVRIGDDLWLGDINVANTTRLSGAQNSDRAFVVFGNSDTIALGRTATNALHYGGNFVVAGVLTATSFSGSGANLTGIVASYASTAGVSTYASTAGIATYATSAGIATYATTAGIATYTTTAGIATYATTAGIATYATTAGVSTYATRAGIATYASTSGVSTYATTAGIATYATTAGVSTNVIGGISSVTQLSVTGVSTLGFVTAGNVFSTGIITASGGFNLGISSAGTTITSGPIKTLNFVGSGNTFAVNGTTVDISISGGGGGSNVSISTVAPSSPTAGTLWYNSNLARTFIYYNDGSSSQWVDVAPFNQGANSTVTVSSSAPTSPREGQLWYSTNLARTFIYYSDGTSSQWVDAAPFNTQVNKGLTIGTRTTAVTLTLVGTGLTISLRSGVGTASF